MNAHLLAPLLFSALTTGHASAQLLVPTDQDRQIQVSAIHSFGGSDFAQTQANSFGPFDETLSVFEPASMMEIAEATAEQVSTIRPTAITATGSIGAQRIGSEATASARSAFLVTFEVHTSVRYALRADLQADQQSKAMYSLVSPDFTFYATGLANELFPTFETTLSGILMPGIYVFAGSAQSLFTGLPFDEFGSSNFSLSLELEPASSSDCITTANSTGGHSVLTSFGQPDTDENDFSLRVSGLPPSVAGVFLYGQLQPSIPFGAGVLCLGSPLFRFPSLTAVTSDGFALEPIPFDQVPFASGPGAILPGSTWSFQFWHRDVTPSGPSWNTSDTLTTTFVP